MAGNDVAKNANGFALPKVMEFVAGPDRTTADSNLQPMFQGPTLTFGNALSGEVCAISCIVL